MARKGARAAPARKKSCISGLGDEDLASIQDALDSGRSLDLGLLLRMISADKPCPGFQTSQCKCPASNPNCVSGLIPMPGRYRMKGLWSKESTAVSGLGPDPVPPSLPLNEQEGNHPVGLVNLGSTCYVNVVLQTLFAIAPFRHAVYAAVPPLSEDPVVMQLRTLFAEMEWGAQDPLDPIALVSALQIDHAIQQDGQEFMKLFLGLIESRFDAQPKLSKIVAGLFQGQSMYQTRCLECGSLSASSGRQEPFYELPAAISGHPSLEHSLEDLFAAEHLSGSNCVTCDVCNAKTEAIRQLRVASAPPLLCISLQRFVFDYQKMDRIKVNEPLSIPMELNLDAILRSTDLSGSDVGTSSCQGKYRLAALMLHKGSTARSGHYVAHVDRKMLSLRPSMEANTASAVEGGDVMVLEPSDSKGDWWRFDDAKVTQIPNGSASVSDHGSALSLKAAAQKLQQGHQKSLSRAGILSCTAYQLLYCREDAIMQLPAVDMPDAAEAWIAERQAMAISFQKSGKQEYERAKEALLARRVQLQDLIRHTLQTASVPETESGRIVSSAWLQRVCDAEPGAANQGSSEGPELGPRSGLSCQHDGLSPNAILSAGPRRISEGAWRTFSEIACGNALGTGTAEAYQLTDLCRECLATEVSGSASAALQQARLREKMEQVAQLLHETDDVTKDQSNNVFVSSAWLSLWLAKKGQFSSLAANSPGPLTGVLCPHGKLAPHRSRTKSKRVMVPADLAKELIGLWAAKQKMTKEGSALVSGEKDSMQDIKAVPIDLSECQQCHLESASAAAIQQQISERRQVERTALPTLAHAPAPLKEIFPGNRWALVPAEFMRSWRSWIKGSDASEPPDLELSMLDCLADATAPVSDWTLAAAPGCPMSRRGKWFVEGAPSSGFETVFPSEWDLLAGFYSLSDGLRRGFQAELVLCPSSAGAYQEVSQAGLVNPTSPSTAVVVAQDVEWHVVPPVCERAVRTRQAEEESRALQYQSAEIGIKLVTGDEALHPTEPSHAPATSRFSKRARRGFVVLTLDSMCTVSELTAQIYQNLGVLPPNVELYASGQKLDGEGSKTLMDLRVLPGSSISVVDTGRFSAEDCIGLLPAISVSDTSREQDAGFKGTVLTQL